MKLILFLFTLFIGAIALFFSTDLLQTYTLKDKEVAQFDFQEFKIFEVNVDGVQKVLYGTEGQKYRDKTIIKSAVFVEQSNALIETVRSDHILEKKAIYYLTGHVVYERNDGVIFKSDEATYDKKKNIFYTNVPFELFNASYYTQGKQLAFYKNSGKIVARNIQAKAQVND